MINDNVLIKKLAQRKKKDIRAQGWVYRYLYKQLKYTTVDDVAFSDANIYCARLMNLIQDKDFYLYLDAYGRVHTNLTNLKKIHRKHLKFKGESLIQVDIKNSQPLFLNVLLKKAVNDGLIKDAPDVHEYQKLTEAGKFYDECAEILNIKNDKNQLKNFLFRYVFFGRRMSRKFAARFPSVAKVVRFYKRKNYCNLARELQRAEAHIMYDLICNRIMKERPEVCLLTIHDCIMTQSNYAEWVASVIMEEFGKIGLGVAVEIAG
jgi:hypothetical protein